MLPADAAGAIDDDGRVQGLVFKIIPGVEGFVGRSIGATPGGVDGVGDEVVGRVCGDHHHGQLGRGEGGGFIPEGFQLFIAVGAGAAQHKERHVRLSGETGMALSGAIRSGGGPGGSHPAFPSLGPEGLHGRVFAEIAGRGGGLTPVACDPGGLGDRGQPGQQGSIQIRGAGEGAEGCEGFERLVLLSGPPEDIGQDGLGLHLGIAAVGITGGQFDGLVEVGQLQPDGDEALVVDAFEPVEFGPGGLALSLPEVCQDLEFGEGRLQQIELLGKRLQGIGHGLLQGIGVLFFIAGLAVGGIDRGGAVRPDGVEHFSEFLEEGGAADGVAGAEGGDGEQLGAFPVFGGSAGIFQPGCLRQL